MTVQSETTKTSTPHTKTDRERITLVQKSEHTAWEDVLAILIGVLLVSFGVFLFQQANIVVGGVAGMALVSSYATGWDFGVLFFTLNLPFYLFGLGGMGIGYIAKTFSAVALLSVVVRLIPYGIDVGDIHPALASVMGGVMIGLGLLALFRHGAGLGGVNILVYWLQSTRNIRAGYVSLGIDLIILLAALLVIGWQAVAWSVVGAVILNVILGINHKPGRYMGAS